VILLSEFPAPPPTTLPSPRLQFALYFYSLKILFLCHHKFSYFRFLFKGEGGVRKENLLAVDGRKRSEKMGIQKPTTYRIFSDVVTWRYEIK